MSKKSFVDKVREVPYKLGEVYSNKANTFYIITKVEYNVYCGSVIEVTRLGKNLKSQGNKQSYWAMDFNKKFEPLTEAQKLLFLQD